MKKPQGIIIQKTINNTNRRKALKMFKTKNGFQIYFNIIMFIVINHVIVCQLFFPGLRAIICNKAEVEMAPHVFATEGNALSIRFYRNRGFNIRTYIKMVFTVFRQGNC